MTAPPVGVLEELDGGQIVPRPAPRRAISWPRAMARATRLTAGRPRAWAFALLAFLARGGLVALVIPMLVLPSFVGLSNTVGPTSVTAAGPTGRLIALIATWAAVVLAAIVGGTLVAAAAEVALYRAALTGGHAPAWGDPPAHRDAPRASRGVVRRVAVVRLVLLLPVAIALAAAVPAWVQVAYRELLLPTDLGLPLPLRVIAGAPIATAVLVAVWLAAEVLGGLAARRITLAGSSIAGALRGAAADVARAPASTALTIGLSVAGTLPILAAALVVVGLAWGRARVALVDGTDAVSVIVSTLVLVAAWAGCLLLAGATGAWRSALWTAELGRRERPS